MGQPEVCIQWHFQVDLEPVLAVVVGTHNYVGEKRITEMGDESGGWENCSGGSREKLTTG